ncbi:glycosyltransferase family 4 protein [Orrella sp. JC864]|uniref:glycosyltransferase family 4 protein n=1 Tax=Orrella sp. JC864 TaxID=3120298 RepID=UPI0012BC2ED1
MSQPLRILHTEAATSFGGQEHRIFKEMHAMRARGHVVEALCQPQAQLVGRLREAGFTVHTLPMGGALNYLKGVPRVVRLLRQGRYDVVNTHSRIDTLIGGTAARLAGTPLIVRTRHLSNKVGSMLSYTWLPHRVTTVSDHVRGYLISRGVPAGRVATVYSPIALPALPEHSTLRQELNLPADAVVVGCVAVMRVPKGHRELIEAIEPLMRTRPGLHLVLVGSGSPVFEQVQAQVAELGLHERIHLLGTRRDVPQLLVGCDLFALATWQEASGTVFVEAAWAGLPVVGYDVGGVAEMMQPGVNGLLVPARDVAAFRQALRSLIDDPARRREMGQRGRQWLLQEGRFTLERLAERTESLYRQWLDERRT